MKVTATAVTLLLSILTPLASACACIDVDMINDPFTGDVMSATLIDNGQTICDSYDGPKFLASDQTHFYIPCISGFGLEIWGNGQYVKYTTPWGVFQWTEGAARDVYQCYTIGEGEVPINCTEFTAHKCNYCGRKRSPLERRADMSFPPGFKHGVKHITDKEAASLKGAIAAKAGGAKE